MTDNLNNSLKISSPDTVSRLILPAAGRGLRMEQISHGQPKEMLKIGGRPVIQYSLIEGFSAGIDEIIIVISRQKEIIREYIEDESFRRKKFADIEHEMEAINERCQFHFLYQDKPRGEMDAIGLTKEKAKGRSVAVIYPDNVFLSSVSALPLLVDSFTDLGMDVIGLISDHERHLAGRVNLKPQRNGLYRIEKIYSKTEGPGDYDQQSKLRACGMAVYGPHLFDYIEICKKVILSDEFTDEPVRSSLIKEKGLYGCRLPEQYFDVGSPHGYTEACRFADSYPKFNEMIKFKLSS